MKVKMLCVIRENTKNLVKLSLYQLKMFEKKKLLSSKAAGSKNEKFI